MILRAIGRKANTLATGWFDERRMYEETVLLSPHISTFSELLKFVMPVIISLRHTVHVTYMYMHILFHYFFIL